MHCTLKSVSAFGALLMNSDDTRAWAACFSFCTLLVNGLLATSAVNERGGCSCSKRCRCVGSVGDRGGVSAASLALSPQAVFQD